MRLVPFFLPGMGCPGRCVFCDQRAQTGVTHGGLERALISLAELLTAMDGSFALGFFGGTFTGLPPEWQKRFLEQAARFRKNGALTHLRVSTRPDRIDRAALSLLHTGGVDMVELGVQSFSTPVLAASGRGYDGARAIRACEDVRDGGFELGIQLLPGLPGHDAGLWREDAAHVVALRPEVVRVYPCVVIGGTPLADMHAQGEYTPWSLPLAVEETARAVLGFWRTGIRVIRLGLAAQPDMLARLQAGPWHPAFGNMVRSAALRLFLEERLAGLTGRICAVWIPRTLSGDLWGHGRANVPALARIGVTRERVKFWSEADIGVELSGPDPVPGEAHA